VPTRLLANSNGSILPRFIHAKIALCGHESARTQSRKPPAGFLILRIAATSSDILPPRPHNSGGQRSTMMSLPFLQTPRLVFCPNALWQSRLSSTLGFDKTNAVDHLGSVSHKVLIVSDKASRPTTSPGAVGRDF
jgi:hypothetical protein